MITFETDVRIERPLEDVFAYISQPLNFPRWNSAVDVVRETSAREGGVGSTHLMERDLPTRRAVNRLDIVASEAPHEFAIRASAGPAPFLYRYRFASDNGNTVVKLDAEIELPGAAALLPQLARRVIKSGVDDNLATLKRILELGGR
jgi:ligand-binding SRPBCC domain-containing protein